MAVAAVDLGIVPLLLCSVTEPIHSTGLSAARLKAFGAAFAHEHGMSDDADTFSRAALIAQDFSKYHQLDLPEEDVRVLSREFTHRWSRQ